MTIMDEQIFARIFIDSPDDLDSGYQFTQLLSIHLKDLANINFVNIERYWKIVEYIEIEVDIFSQNSDDNILLFFASILRKLGSGWKIMGDENYPSAIWNKEQNSCFFVEDVVWAHIEVIYATE